MSEDFEKEDLEDMECDLVCWRDGKRYTVFPKIIRSHWLATIQIRHGECEYSKPILISTNDFYQDTNRWFNDIQILALNWYFGKHKMEDADEMNNGYLIECGDRYIELKLDKRLSFVEFYILKKHMIHLDYDKVKKEERANA